MFGVFGQTMVEREIRRVLAPIKGFDPDDREALSLWNTAIESVMFSKMMQSMKNFFLGVSLITLVLGGIGVMNIMLIAVRERTREIGLRKALGATSHSIHRQFIVEGLALTLLSGAIGLAGGWGLCELINMLPMPARFSGMIITPGNRRDRRRRARRSSACSPRSIPLRAPRRCRRSSRCGTRPDMRLYREVISQALGSLARAPVPRGAHHARHLVGHRHGRAADGVRHRIPARDHVRLSQRVLAGDGARRQRPDEHAGGRRAIGPPHHAEAGRCRRD